MKKQWWQKEVVYQIYPKSFADANHDGIGDIKGITSKLDYLHTLGITMLWICPIFKSPMDDNGYDISDYFNIAPEYGTIDDVKELLDEAKKRDIKIILDLVINHTSDEHPWFQAALQDPTSPYHDYYIFRSGTQVPNNWRSVFGTSVWEKVAGRDEYYFHSFGKKQPDLNWENPALRHALYDMVNHWLGLGIAGFRVDAITFIKKDLSFKNITPDGNDGLGKCTRTCRNQKGIETFLQELKMETFAQHNCVTVAEAPGVGYDELDDFIGEDGYFSMIFDFKHADLDIASGSEWFRRKDWTIQDLNDRLMTSQMAVQKVGWAATFIENHDQPRATSKYLLDHAGNADAIKMMGAMYFFLRGTPFIYQGQELGMSNVERSSIAEFDDISSIDQYYRAIQEGFDEQEALHFINLRSRDNTRTPFPWNASTYGGFSTHAPWLAMNPNHDTINAENALHQKDSIFHFYQTMICLRNKSPYQDCLIYGDIQPIQTHPNVIAYLRYTKEQRIACYFNFAKDAISIPIKETIDTIILNNLDTLIQMDTTLTLQPFQALMFTIKEGETYA